MKITIDDIETEYEAKINILDFFDIHRINLSVFNQFSDKPPIYYTACLNGALVEVIEGVMLSSYYGKGKTLLEAINDLSNLLSEKNIRISGVGRLEVYIRAPKFKKVKSLK